MGKQSAGQTYNRQLIDQFAADGDVADACAKVLELRLRDEEELLCLRINRVTGRDAEIVSPYKGTDARAVLDGIVFAMGQMKDQGDQLTVVVPCPVCGDESQRYWARTIKELAYYIIRSQHDSRCPDCVEAEYLGRRLAEYGHDGHKA